MVRAKGKARAREIEHDKELERTAKLPTRKVVQHRISHVGSGDIINVVTGTLDRVASELGINVNEASIGENATIFARYLKYGIGVEHDQYEPFQIREHEFRRIPLCRKHR